MNMGLITLCLGALAVSISAADHWDTIGLQYRIRGKMRKACEDGDIAVVHQLLQEHGNGLLSGICRGFGPFATAAFHGKTELVRYLLETASIERTLWYNGPAAVHAATQAGHVAVLELLLEAGVRTDEQNKHGWTSLMLAAENGYASIVPMLLKAGAKVNQANRGGWTPLMMAADKGYAIIVQQLLHAGADCSHINEYGKFALYRATIQGHEAVVQLLLVAGGRVNQITAAGNTSLMAACSLGHLRIVNQLLAAGADLHIARQGATALHFAALEAHVDVVMGLLRAGADPDRKADCGTSILGALVQGLNKTDPRSDQRCAIARMLLHRGLSCYTSKQLDLLGISAEQAHQLTQDLRNTCASMYDQLAIDTGYANVPADLAQLIGSFVGGSLA